MMSEAWREFLVLESVDLVKRSYSERHGRELNTTAATEIVAQFLQGREYFETAATAGPLVKPLLIYYGVVALSRGVTLLLSKGIRECGLERFAHQSRVPN